MALPPFFDQPERARPYFRQMRELLDMLRQESLRPERLAELSMGMSGDFEVAVEEGSTLVRIGTSAFLASRSHSHKGLLYCRLRSGHGTTRM